MGREMIKQSRLVLGFLTLLGMLAGCHSGRTETGYEPRHLGMSNGTLRSLYAPAFSPEAQAAENDKKHEADIHRPTY
jgi:hypothetical protein